MQIVVNMGGICGDSVNKTTGIAMINTLDEEFSMLSSVALLKFDIRYISSTKGIFEAAQRARQTGTILNSMKKGIHVEKLQSIQWQGLR